jgi:sugar/nucleoside kinase (ribokinase family)
MTIPDIVVAGQVTIDITTDGLRPGGPGAFCSLVASRLGLRAGLLTSAGPDFDVNTLLPNVEVVLCDSSRTAMMEHIWKGRERIQYVRERGGAIAGSVVPEEWRQAGLLMLSPLLSEVSPSLEREFPQAMAGAAAQGWLRQVRNDGRVEEGNLGGLDLERLAGRLTVLSLSEVDLRGSAVPPAWLEAFPIILLTHGDKGFQLHHDARWWAMSSFPAVELDPTGAGDTFATAFLVRYSESGDLGEAARFAAAAASCVVEGQGLAAVPSRPEAESRLAEHRDIQLRPST